MVGTTGYGVRSHTEVSLKGVVVAMLELPAAVVSSGGIAVPARIPVSVAATLTGYKGWPPILFSWKEVGPRGTLMISPPTMELGCPVVYSPLAMYVCVRFWMVQRCIVAEAVMATVAVVELLSEVLMETVAVMGRDWVSVMGTDTVVVSERVVVTVMVGGGAMVSVIVSVMVLNWVCVVVTGLDLV